MTRIRACGAGRIRRQAALWAAGAAALASIAPAMGNTQYMYTGPSGTTAAPVTGNFNSAGNWSNGAIPASDSTTELDFSNSATNTYTATDDLTGALSLNVLQFDTNSTSGGTSATIAAGTGNSLNFITNTTSSATPSITQNGTSVFTVSAPVTATNALTFGIGSGVTNSTAGAVTFSGAFTNTGGISVTGGNYTVSGVVSGAGAINVSGGTLYFSNTNTFTGPTINVSGGNFIIAGGGSFGAQPNSTTNPDRTITLTNGGEFTVNASYDLNTSNGYYPIISIGSGGGIINQVSGTLELNDASEFNGTGNLTKIGPGLIDFATSYAFTGGMTVEQGTIQIDNASGVGTATSIAVAPAALGAVVGGTTLSGTVGANLNIINNITFARPISIAGTGIASAGALTDGSSGQTSTLTGGITLTANASVGGNGNITVSTTGINDGGGGYALTKVGAGVVALGAADTYTGGTTVSAGTLSFLTTSSMPGYPTPTGGVTVAAGATLAFGVGAATGSFTNSDIAGYLAGTHGVTFASTSLLGYDTTNETGGSFTVTTVPTGSMGLAKLGAGVLNISSAASYTGNTTVYGGVLAANDGAGLSANSLLNLDGIQGAGGSFSPINGSFTRALGTAAGNVELTGGISGFTAVGTPTTINLGGASAAVTWAAPFSPGALLLNDTAATSTLNFQNPINLNGAVRTITVNSTAAGTTATLSGALTSTSGGITKNGAGVLQLTAANIYTGATTISAGTLSFAGASALPASTTIQPQGGTVQLLNDGAGNNGNITIPNAFSFTASATSTINVGNNGANSGSANTGNTVSLSTFNVPSNSSNTINFTASNGYLVKIASLGLPGSSGATTTLVPSSTSITITGNVTNNGTGGSGNFDTLVLDGTSTGNIIQGVISDASGATADSARYTPVTKQNTSTWTLAGANTYTGNTTLSAGTLILTNPLAMQNSHAALNGGTLDLRYDSSATFSNNKQTSTFSIAFGANTNIDVDAADASGVSGSTLSMLDMGINGSYTVTTSNNGGANNYNLATGAVTIAGNYNPTFTNNMVNGTTTLASLGESTSTTAAQTITFNGTSASAITAITGPISQNAANALIVTQSGTGTLILNGANTYTGATNVNAGTLALGYSTANSVGASIGTSAVNVLNGATFAARPGVNNATNSLGSSLTLNAGAHLSMVDGAYSTLNVTGATQLAPASGASTTLAFELGVAADGSTPVNDTLNITGAASDGAAGVQIALTGIGTTAPAPGTGYTLINANGGGLTSTNFSLANSRVVIDGVAYSAVLVGAGTVEEVELNTLSSTTAYYTGNGGTTALNATSSGGATNFSSDAAGQTDFGTQPTGAQDVYFTATSVSSSTPVTIASLGQAYTFNSLNFTSNAPAVTINNGGSANALTIAGGGITVASGAGAPTINVPVIVSVPQTFTNNSATNTLSLTDGVTASNNLLTFAGPGATTISGTAAFTTSAGVTINSGAGAVTISAPVTIGGASIFTNNSANTLTLGGAVAAGGNATTVTGTGNTTIGGNFTSTSTLTKTGTGTLAFNGAANSLVTLNLNSNSTVNIGSGILTLNNTGASTIQSTTGGTISGAGSLKFSSSTYPNFADNGTVAGTTLTISANIISNGTGASTDGFEVYGGGNTAGTVILSGQNKFLGDINIDGGTLQVANIGMAGTSDTTSPLGEGTNILILNGGTCGLRYTGTGESTNRVIYLEGTTTAGFIDQSGTGTLDFTANFATPGAGAKTLVLQGSTTGIGEIDGIIPNNPTSGDTTAITKSGTGTWILTAANTYSGPTTITGGTLLVNNVASGTNSGTGTSAVTVTTGVIGGSGSIAGPASIGAAGTLSPGAGGSPAILTIGSGSGTSVLSFASNTSTYQVNITGAGDSGTGLARAGATYDSVNNANTSTTPLALASARLSLVDNAVASGTYDILQNAHDDGMTAGQFFTYNNGSSIVNLTNGSTFTGGANAFTILYDVNSTDTGAGSDIVLVAAATPEPAALGLLAVGAGGLLARRRRRAAKHRA